MFNLKEVLNKLQTSLENEKLDEAIRLIESLRSADQADLFAELDDEDQTELLPRLKPADSADILEYLDDQEAADLASTLPNETVARIMDEMEPDEAADLLGNLSPQQSRAVLAKLEDPEEVRPLLFHADDSAGGLMTSEFLALRPRMKASEAIEALRAWKPDAETIYYLFVVDQDKKLSGVVSLRDLITAMPDTLIVDIMKPNVISVKAGTDQEECARILSHYDLLALPVVNDDNVLLGVITVDDVVDVLQDEATEDIQRMGGAEPLEQPYLETGVLQISRKRIGWLLLLFITEMLTGTVLRHFQGELQSVVALSFFVPLLIGTGGNAGSQTTSTIIRALAVGDVALKDALRALWHEFRTGLLLGVGLAALAFFRALTWGSSMSLAQTVSIAIFVIVVWANVLGAVLPMLATKLGVDPPIVSGPVMSTLVDATGLFIYFTIARLLLHI
ncbi:MAG TPA: magnesium transporter [Anaerolineales bacterium]|jgi:magnesium transporter